MAVLAMHKMAEINVEIAERNFRQLARTVSATIDGEHLDRTMPKDTPTARQYVYDELGKIRDLDPSIDSVGLFAYKEGFRRIVESPNRTILQSIQIVTASSMLSC